jgi:peptidoglycan/xylan/chitin deacetylase (PgdA/CDA1 family)
MKYNPKIHKLNHVCKSIIGYFEKFICGITYSNNELIVLNYHSTPKKFNANFEKQVLYLKDRFNIISPADLDRYYFDSSWKSDKPALIFSFDDGLKNNLNAVSVLEKYNIKALFFLVPNFINSEKNNQKEFYITNIRPVINKEIDSEPDDFTALSWPDLKLLISKDHVVGAHTLSHNLIAQNSTLQNSTVEIVNCKSVIEKALGIKINSFCSINNTALSVAKKEKILIEENYKYHFTTFPGFNAKRKNSMLIKRRNVESYWLMGVFYFALGKMDLYRWNKKINTYKDL